MSWASVGSPPGGLSRVQSYQVVLETEVGLLCDDFKMVFCARLGGKRYVFKTVCNYVVCKICIS